MDEVVDVIMDPIEVPFVKTVGITKTDNGLLTLNMTQSVANHIGTMHGSALFTLAETASGHLLIESFPDLEGKAIPVLRDSKIKFKRPAKNTVVAQASVSQVAADTLRKQIATRGRGLIEISVEIKDSNDKVTCVGMFNWFIQSVA